MNENSKSKEEGGFFSRWSRLKTEQIKTEQALNATDNEQSNSLQIDKLSEDETTIDVNKNSVSEIETPVLTDADMPDIETLNGDSDYSGFLSPGVSEELRKLALRKLFNTEYFQIRDGLDDYDEEFTHFEKLGDIITADMRFQMEEEAKAKLKQELENQPAQDEEQLAETIDGEVDSDAEEDIEEEIEDIEAENEETIVVAKDALAPQTKTQTASQDIIADDDKPNENLL